MVTELGLDERMFEATALSFDNPDFVEVVVSHFAQVVEYRQTPVGHNTPQEDPNSVVSAILALRQT